MAKKENKKLKELKSKDGKMIRISAQLLANLTEEEKQELEDMVTEQGDETPQKYMKESQKLFPKVKIAKPITWRNR